MYDEICSLEQWKERLRSISDIDSAFSFEEWRWTKTIVVRRDKHFYFPQDLVRVREFAERGERFVAMFNSEGWLYRTGNIALMLRRHDELRREAESLVTQLQKDIASVFAKYAGKNKPLELAADLEKRQATFKDKIERAEKKLASDAEMEIEKEYLVYLEEAANVHQCSWMSTYLSADVSEAFLQVVFGGVAVSTLIREGLKSVGAVHPDRLDELDRAVAPNKLSLSFDIGLWQPVEKLGKGVGIGKEAALRNVIVASLIARGKL